MSRKREREKESDEGTVPIPHRIKVACDFCAKAKVKCTGNVPCENCFKKGIACHVRHSRSNAINTDGQFAPYSSNIPLSQVAVETQAQPGSDVVPSLPPGIQTSRFDLFDTFRVDTEVNNLFLGLFDGFDASVRDIRQALEFLAPFPEPETTSVLPNPVRAIEQSTGLLGDHNPLIAETPASVQDGPLATAETPKRNEFHCQNSHSKKIFDTSPLVWRPAHDDHKRDTQRMSSLQLSAANAPSTLSIAVADSSRDAVVVMVSLALQIYAPNVKPTFPPLSAFNFFLSSFFKLAHQFSEVVHRASFDPNECEPTLLAAMVAVGAILQGREIKSAHVFGLGMLELTRLAIDYLVRKFSPFPNHLIRPRLRLTIPLHDTLRSYKLTKSRVLQLLGRVQNAQWNWRKPTALAP